MSHDLVERWRGRRVVVMGDILLDRWLSGTPRRLCREAPAPVVDLDRVDEACGGAANTAVNLAALGASPVLVGLVGDDAAGERVRQKLRACGVEDRLVAVPGRRTVTKSRLIADGQILARFDDGDTEPPPPGRGIPLDDLDGDALVLCDYDAGTLTDEVRDHLLAERARLPLLVVDAHWPERWRRLRPTLVTPSFAEVRLPTTDSRRDGRDRADMVLVHARDVFAGTGASIAAVTMDVDGAVVLVDGGSVHRTYAEPMPASHSAGAGDAYTAAFTLALLAGAAPSVAADAAQRAATAATRGPGTCVCPLSTFSDGAKMLRPASLVSAAAAYRAVGRKLVLTNGFFDGLHHGHVAYLQQARRMGDVLIVGLNADDSVRRLRGVPPRHPLEERSAMLAALHCVDHLTVFSDDRATRLIDLLRPDVYVKGGDYLPQLMEESDLVERHGGAVHVVGYVPGQLAWAGGTR
jgi:D-beta-D-heptose 7-phosphate kinase/D-beta-D-heptose 1-phosphate adenosyltransferase